jgi:hypothetical protein
VAEARRADGSRDPAGGVGLRSEIASYLSPAVRVAHGHHCVSWSTSIKRLQEDIMDWMRLKSVGSLGQMIGCVLALGAVMAAPAASAAGLEQRLLAKAVKAQLLARPSTMGAIAPRAGAAENAAYQFVTVDVPGAAASAAYGVNDAGLISGYFFDASFNFHGFVQQDGVATVHDYPQALETALGDPNDAGIVIGNFGDVAQHAVLLDAETGTWTVLPDIAGLPVNLGDGINNRGVATGVACAGNFVTLVFLNCVSWTWNGSGYSFFQHPDASLANGGTSAQGINDRNQVAGFFTDANSVNHGFVKDRDGFRTIDVPNATNTFTFDINDRGETAGYYIDQVGVFHGFVEHRGTFITVDVPGAALTFIYGNNARGDLAGEWYDANFVGHGFVALKGGAEE